MINFRQLCEDKGVEIAPLSYTCTTEGWVNIKCCHCDDAEYRLGYNESSGFFFCLRCGWHSEAETLHGILSTNKGQTYEIIKEYKTRSNTLLPKYIPTMNTICDLPEGCTTMKKPHCDYLRDRDFDPQELAEKWDLQGTTAVGDYNKRIIAPIRYKGVLCSYQGRDVSGEAMLRYKACKEENEVIKHKHLLYGYDQALAYGQCILVEGITDVWRLGYGAVCTFGIKWTDYQMRMLANNFKRVYIAYDTKKIVNGEVKEEVQARKEAEKLRNELIFRGVDCHLIDIDAEDPAKMEQEDADNLMKKIGFITWEKR